MSYNFDREQAADELAVSTRTLDRYVKSGKIRTKRIGKKIFLNDDDIRSIKNESPEIVRPTDTKVSDEIVFFDEEVPQTNFRKKPVMIDYRDLYEDALRRMAEKDRVIQDLSYRAGHAESELKHSISLAEYKKTTFLLESAKSKTEEEKQVFETKVSELQTAVKKERSLVYVLLSLVTLLLLMSATLSFFVF